MTSRDVNGSGIFTGNVRVEGTLTLPNNPLTVGNGGTGFASDTAYAPICGGTTATGVLQNVTTGLSTAGYVLTSNGSSALPSFQAPGGGGAVVTKQVFTASGTYTPSANMKYCIVELVGGGGGGGGTANAVSNQCVGGGGGSGGYAMSLFTAAQIGASKAVTIGGAGTAESSSGGAGGTGGTSSFGTLIVCVGGTGGGGGGDIFVWDISEGGNGGGVTTVGNVYTSGGQYGRNGFSAFHSTPGSEYIIKGGTGGSSQLGMGGTGPGAVNGRTGVGYGSGGGGAGTINGVGRTGGAGRAGICIILEFA
jgi:hypothetical protein